MKNKKTITVLLADDHTIVREGIRDRINLDPDIRVIGEVCNGQDAVEQAIKLRPSVILMDISMPVMNGLEATKQLLTRVPNIKIIMFTMHDNQELIHSATRIGAKGYILKDVTTEQMIAGIKSVHQGELFYCSSSQRLLKNGTTKKDPPVGAFSTLTKREQTILSMVTKGLNSKAIAGELFISVRTAETHRRNIMKKLDIHTSIGLIRYVIENKFCIETIV